jgi:hypothetical protein
MMRLMNLRNVQCDAPQRTSNSDTGRCDDDSLRAAEQCQFKGVLFAEQVLVIYGLQSWGMNYGGTTYVAEHVLFRQGAARRRLGTGNGAGVSGGVASRQIPPTRRSANSLPLHWQVFEPDG